MPVQIKPLPSLARLQELFVYHPELGEIHHRRTIGRARKGERAGCVSPRGYLFVSIDLQNYQVHRVIWKMHHGVDPVRLDHIIGTLDNRIDNLREATVSQNGCNTRLRLDNSTGVKGISVDAKRKKKWRATIMLNQKYIQIGRFYSKDEATAAINAARKRLHGEFARFT